MLIRSPQSLVFSGLNNPNSLTQSELQILNCLYVPLLGSLYYAHISAKLLSSRLDPRLYCCLGLFLCRYGNFFELHNSPVSPFLHHVKVPCMWQCNHPVQAAIPPLSVSPAGLPRVPSVPSSQGINANVKLYSFQY